MAKKQHWTYIDENGTLNYLCHKGVKVRNKRVAKTWDDVECRNCNRVRNFLIKNNISGKL